MLNTIKPYYLANKRSKCAITYLKY